MEKDITNIRRYVDIALEINAEKTKWATGIWFEGCLTVHLPHEIK